MGSSYGIDCDNCDYNKEFMTGVGMLYSPNSILDFKNEYLSLSDLVEPEIFKKANFFRSVSVCIGVTGQNEANEHDTYGT